MKLCNRNKERICTKQRKVYLLSQIAPVLFVRKKNEKKRIVQNYQYLNKWTIKNNHPLPLISDIVENISTKKVFTKIRFTMGV